MSRCRSYSSIILVCLPLIITLCACNSNELSFAGQQQSIVGGTKANADLLPAVGALAALSQSSHSNSSKVIPFCTATLISDRLILSAAHCVKAIGEDIPASLPIVFFTGLDASATDAASKTLAIKSWKANEGYAGGEPPTQLTDWNDIAILELATPTTAITPMKMVRPTEASALYKYGTEVKIVGYGLTNADDQYSSGVKYWGTTKVNEVGTYEVLLYNKNASHQCNGDSGGPIVAETASGNQDYRILGVASRGDTDCSYGNIDTRVDSYLDWIHDQGSIPCGSGLSADCTTTKPPTDASIPVTKKAVGEDCSTHDECTSKLCLLMDDGTKTCSNYCPLDDSSCPDGFQCVAISGRTDGACMKRTAIAETTTGATPDSSTGSGCSFAAGPVVPGTTSFLFAALALLGLALASRRR